MNRVIRRLGGIVLGGALLVATGIACSTPGEPAVSATESAASTSAAEDAAAVEAELREIAVRVSSLVDMGPAEAPPVTLIDTDELRDLVDALLGDPDAAASLESDEQLFKILGLIPADVDYADLNREMLVDGVAGLYVPERQALYVRMFGRFSATEEAVAAHEFMHYVQDMNFDLERMQDEAGSDRDRQAALSALIEGDATIVQQDYMTEHLSPAQQFGMLLGSLFVTPPPSAPLVMIRETTFAYLDGADFVAAVMSEGVSRATLYESPPVTAEQILHPERYLDGEERRPVTFTLPESALPDGWGRSSEVRLGELLLRTWLEEVGAGYGDAAAAADGWGGDSAYVLVESGEAVAVLARIEWDTRDEAMEFYSIVSAALDESRDFDPDVCATCSYAAWRGPVGILGLASDDAVPGAPTTLAIAPTVEGLDRLIVLAAATP